MSDPTSTDSPDTDVAPKKGTSVMTWIVAAVVTVAVAGGVIFFFSRSDSGSTASANSTAAAAGGQQGTGTQGQPGQGRRPGVSGTISAIEGSRITVDQADGTVTKVTTDSSTTVSITKDVAISQIAVGDEISVSGTTTGTSIAADRITDQGNAAALQAERDQMQQQRGQSQQGQQGQNGQVPGGGGFTPPTNADGTPMTPPDGAMPGGQQGQQGQNGGQRRGNMTRGEVTAVNGSTITMRTNDGTEYTVTANAGATITKSSTATIADLAVGDTINVMGQMDANGAVTANRIMVGNGAFGPGGPGGPGGPAGPPGQQSTTTTIK